METLFGVETKQERFDGRAWNAGPHGEQREQLPIRRPVECCEIGASGLEDLKETPRLQSITMGQAGDPRRQKLIGERRGPQRP